MTTVQNVESRIPELLLKKAVLHLSNYCSLR